MEYSTFTLSNSSTIGNRTATHFLTTISTGLSNYPDAAIIAALLIGLKVLLEIAKGTLRKSLASRQGACCSIWSKLLESILFQHVECGMNVETALDWIQKECDVQPTSKRRKNVSLDQVDGSTPAAPTTSRVLKLKFRIPI
jgi:hypothetical protein